MLKVCIFSKEWKRARSNFSEHFMPARSTVTNFVSIIEYIGREFDCRRQVDVVYTDFSSAFDSVDFGILLKKLS